MNASTAAKNEILSGGDIKATYASGTITFYSGTKPVSADEAPGSDTTKLATFSSVNWNVAVNGEMVIAALVTAVTLAAGVASWFRMTTTAGNPDADDVAIKTEKRWDGTISNSGGGDLNGNTVNLESGQNVELKSTIKFKFA